MLHLRPLVAVLCAGSLLCAFDVAAACSDLAPGEVSGVPLNERGLEKFDAGWAFYVDNDVLIPINRDEDYTGGFAATFAGRRAQEWWISLDTPLGALDHLFGVSGAGCDTSYTLHSLQVGLVAFTPGDIEMSAVVAGDRPYASLLYLANGRRYVSGRENPVWHTSFTGGVLGLNAAGYSQDRVHAALDMDKPRGWNRQISEGGEPTFRYSVARQALLASGHEHSRNEWELTHSVAGSAGYLTEASAALSWRWGRINTPWWSFAPDRTEYVAEPSPVIGDSDGRGGPRELYAWGGIKLHARAYNAFLQGQFRDNDLEYDYGELRPLIGEAWLGITAQISRSTRLSWALRYLGSELKDGAGDREAIWGSIFLSRDL